MIKNSFLFVFILGLSACHSNTQSIRYYSLNLNSFQNSGKMITSDKVRVVIDPIRLVKFLNQDNMIIQIGENEIYKASFHRWAEPLDQSIIKLLVQKLNDKKSNVYQFVKRYGVTSQKSALHLGLEIDQFHSTDNAQVILSGHYRLYTKDQSFEMMEYFNLSDQLTSNGYPHSVQKLKGLLDQLAEQIFAAIESQNFKNKSVFLSYPL